MSDKKHHKKDKKHHDKKKHHKKDKKHHKKSHGKKGNGVCTKCQGEQ